MPYVCRFKKNGGSLETPPRYVFVLKKSTDNGMNSMSRPAFFTQRRDSYRMKEKKTQERRNIDRLKLFYYLTVYDRQTQESIGSVVDISSQGMKMMGEKYFLPDSVRSFTIRLPEGSILGESVEVEARCKWCRENKAEASYESGFEFAKKAESGVFVVKALIDDLQKNNLL